MINDRSLFGPENDRRVLDARELRAAICTIWWLRRVGAGASERLPLAFTALASFSPPRGDATPARSSLAPSEITAGIRNLPESERWDPH